VIFLAVVVALIILATIVIGLLAILAVANPPRLNGHPISIVNLLRQLTSPIDVLAKTLGDGPLAMRIQVDTVDKEGMRFDMTRPSAGDTPTMDDVRSVQSEREIQEIQIDAEELVEPRGFQFRLGESIPRSPAGFQPVRRDTDEITEDSDDGHGASEQGFERERNENRGGLEENRDGSARRDEMSDEEGRVFIGYQQRQLARQNQVALESSRFSWNP
jgi:hypothetical protein